MNHKWLKEDTLMEPILLLSPPLPQQQQVLAVQTSNVTISTNGTEESVVDVIKSCTAAQMTKDDDLDDDEDKENNTLRQLIVTSAALEQQEQLSVPATSTISFHATNGTITTSTTATKLVLEKSSSISLFPAIAPTTPKVCRKMIYEDEADLKEIVKKYQTSCCDDESVADCLVCHPSAIAPSLEIDKGITSC